MPFDGRYIKNEQPFKDDAFLALKSRFPDRESFEEFYESLSSPEKKDEFLRITSFYLFLVKQGDWHISVEGYDPIIDYFTNSFKLVALFSLIESLTDLKHQDFYQWLASQPDSIFPISNKSDLRHLYEDYKKSFGSIRRCVSFFERLPDKQKTALCNSIHINGTAIQNIKKLAQLLYDIRSEFVHAAQLVLLVSESPIFHIEKNKTVRSRLSVNILLDAFEEGVLCYFIDQS
ncbi:hypothetical protein KKG05_06395 [bacterium]|nr:hypothetical protein [bacterium]